MSHEILVFHEIMQSRFEHLDLFILPMYAQAANQVGSIFLRSCLYLASHCTPEAVTIGTCHNENPDAQVKTRIYNPHPDLPIRIASRLRVGPARVM
jgi:hypothetical protein